MPDEPVVPTPPTESPKLPTVPTEPATIWTSAFPDDIKNDPSITKYKSAEELARGHLNLSKHLGQSIRFPGPDAKPEEIAAFREKLGVPKDASEYGEFKPPEGMLWDKEGEKRFYVHAHKQGLTKAQTAAMLEWYTGEVMNGTGRLQEEAKREEESAWVTLRGQWGAATNRNVALAQRAVGELGDPDLAKALDETGLGNHPAFLRFAAKVGEMALEDGVIKGELLGGTPTDFKAELDSIKGDLKHPYWHKDHPGHAAALERVRELYKAVP